MAIHAEKGLYFKEKCKNQEKKGKENLRVEGGVRDLRD